MMNENLKHFFQPLLPGFQSHLNIPVKFFSENIEGKHEGNTVKLRSDASEKTWIVRVLGQRLTEGWKEFVEAHDLRVGDFVIFKHEGNLLFHVTALGPSCCEIQYEQSRSHQEVDEEEEDDVEIDENESSSESEKEAEDNVKTKPSHYSSDLSCFSQSVTALNLTRDQVIVPIGFARRNGFNKERLEIVLMNEEGKSWDSDLKLLQSRVLIVRGWKSFCTANKLEVGDSCTFKLLQDKDKPVFRLCSRTKTEQKKKIMSEEDDKTIQNRFVLLTPTTSSLDFGKQYLPVSFTRENGIVKPGNIILVDRTGADWSMELKVAQRSASMYIWSRPGWKKFCVRNGVNADESLTLELIRGGTSPVLKFCSKMEQIPFEAVGSRHKKPRVQRWSHETEPKLQTREKTVAEGECSRLTRSRSKQGNLQRTQPSSVSDQMAKVKQSVVDSLTSIRRFRGELETMEHKLEDSLQEINNLGSCSYQRGEENENETTSSSDNYV